jgi:Protein of unknown function (DUF2628)
MSERISSVVTYTVHEPPQPQADRVDRADELAFVKDGFSWLTAICPPVGLMAKKLWLELLVYIVIVAALVWILSWADVDTNWIALSVMALGLFLGLEISSLERFLLDRAGWRTIGTVTGRNLAECERRFFESWLPDQPVITATKSGAHHARTSGSTGGWPFGAKA